MFAAILIKKYPLKFIIYGFCEGEWLHSFCKIGFDVSLCDLQIGCAMCVASPTVRRAEGRAGQKKKKPFLKKNFFFFLHQTFNQWANYSIRFSKIL